MTRRSSRLNKTKTREVSPPEPPMSTDSSTDRATAARGHTETTDNNSSGALRGSESLVPHQDQNGNRSPNGQQPMPNLESQDSENSIEEVVTAGVATGHVPIEYSEDSFPPQNPMGSQYFGNQDYGEIGFEDYTTGVPVTEFPSSSSNFHHQQADASSMPSSSGRVDLGVVMAQLEQVQARQAHAFASHPEFFGGIPLGGDSGVVKLDSESQEAHGAAPTIRSSESVASSTSTIGNERRYSEFRAEDQESVRGGATDESIRTISSQGSLGEFDDELRQAPGATRVASSTESVSSVSSSEANFRRTVELAAQGDEHAIAVLEQTNCRGPSSRNSDESQPAAATVRTNSSESDTQASQAGSYEFVAQNSDGDEVRVHTSRRRRPLPSTSSSLPGQVLYTRSLTNATTGEQRFSVFRQGKPVPAREPSSSSYSSEDEPAQKKKKSEEVALTTSSSSDATGCEESSQESSASAHSSAELSNNGDVLEDSSQEIAEKRDSESPSSDSN